MAVKAYLLDSAGNRKAESAWVYNSGVSSGIDAVTNYYTVHAIYKAQGDTAGYNPSTGAYVHSWTIVSPEINFS